MFLVGRLKLSVLGNGSMFHVFDASLSDVELASVQGVQSGSELGEFVVSRRALLNLMEFEE